MESIILLLHSEGIFLPRFCLLFTVSSGNCGARTAHISPSVASLNFVTCGVQENYNILKDFVLKRTLLERLAVSRQRR